MAKEKDAAALDPEIAALLQKIHSNELSGIVRYLHYAHMIFGANRIPIVSWLKKEADTSMEHAWSVGEKMTAFGLHPEMKVDPVTESGKHSVLDVLREALDFEKVALEDYKKLLGLVVAKRPGDTALEDWVRGFVSAEAGHLEEAGKMLRPM